ncbi:MAG: flippase activity-associated protein Agl23, partial [Halobacteriaceae archaeon]
MRWELPEDRAYLSVVLITGISIVMRLYNLGFRMAHWDEGRVGYRILEYLQTGVYQYRPIVHGPFLFQINRRVFSLMGTSDFTARWIVAIIGGLLPAAAWLYRDRLTDAEVVGLAIFFAFNPILVYYSRFMRNDMLVATFMVFALGWFIRAYDHKNTWSLYFGTAAFALGFTTKENAVMYAGIWIGALILLFDHRLFFARLSEQRWTDKASAIISNIISGLIDTWKPIVLAIIEFVIIITVFYAPRPEFWQAFSSPSMFPGLVSKALFGSAQELYSTWIVGGHQAHPYLSFFEDYIKTLRAGALPLVILAIGGFILDRYSGDSPNDLIAFASYWGFASLLLYPLASDIPAPWNT